MKNFDIDTRKAIIVNNKTKIKEGTRLQLIVKIQSDPDDILDYNIENILTGITIKVKGNIIEKAIIFKNEDTDGKLLEVHKRSTVQGVESILEYLGNELIFYKDKAYIVQSYKADTLKEDRKLHLLWTWEE